METQVRTIRVVVDTKNAQGLKKLSTQFGSVNRNVKSMQTNLGGLSRIFRIAIASFGIREVIQSADSFQLLRDRIKVFTGSAEKANKVFGDIAILARETKSSISSFAEGYNRVAIATKGLGLSSDQTLGVVAALQQSLRLSGSSAQEASSVFIQLSQALSLGRLQGQELRAVLLSNATVAKILADEFKTTTGGLKELGEQGKLTSDRVIKALGENFLDLNKKAGDLGTTFQQSLIIALDQFRLKVDELNSTFGLNSKFFKGINFLIKNMETVLKVMTALVVSGVFLKVASQINTMTAAFVTARAAGASMLVALGFMNIGIAAAGAAIGYFSFLAISDFKKFKLSTQRNLLEVRVALAEFDTFIYGVAESLSGLGGLNPFNGLLKSVSKLGNVRLDALAVELGRVTFELSKLEKTKGGTSVEDIIDRINKSLKNIGGKTLGTAVGSFATLNATFTGGSREIQKYREQVDQIKFINLQEQFKQGKITVDQFNDSLFKLRSSFNDLSGSEQILIGIKNGASQAGNDIGSLAQEISGVTKNAFNDLEDRLVTFIKTGKFEFKDFAQAILDDLTRVAIRLSVIRALTNITGATELTKGLTPSANGNVFNKGSVQPFATGGVVSRPTIFPMANGGTGLMGEAGPEAILPLKRGSNGKLGVESNGGGGTIVNVVNNSKGNVETRESTGTNGERQIDVIIVDRVNKAIREGKMDKTMSSTFGVTRRGN